MADRRPTDAQNKARARNWRIRNLRALQALAFQLTGPRRTVAQSAIDEELTLLGAETYSQRVERLTREWKETE